MQDSKEVTTIDKGALRDFVRHEVRAAMRKAADVPLEDEGGRENHQEDSQVQESGTPSAHGAGQGGEILTIPEAAHLLRRSIKGLYRIAARGDLPGAVKVGGKWIVRRSVLLGFAAEGRVSPGRTRR